MRERYYPPAYDRVAETITKLEIESTAAAVYLEGTTEGIAMVLLGMNIGFHTIKACVNQLDEERENLTAALTYAEDALNVHPGWMAPGTKSHEAYIYIADGHNALGAERRRTSGILKGYLDAGNEMYENASEVFTIYKVVQEKLNQAQSAVNYWKASGEENQRVIGLRTVETLVIDLGKENIARAKEQLQPAPIESTTDAENPTAANATAQLRDIKDKLAPLAQRIQDIRTEIGKKFSVFEEAGRALMNWNPEVDGPEPAGLREKHGQMELLIREMNLVLTAKEAELQAAIAKASYEAMDTVTAVAAEAQSMRERAAGHLTRSDEAAETYVQRGYDV